MTTPPPDEETAATGLPALGTWRRVYLLVGFSFVIWVMILVALQWVFR